MKRPAFTLIEITVVLLILAIVAAAVALRVQNPLRHAQMLDVISAISAFDRTARDAAREQGRPLRLVVDPPAGRLSLADDRGQAAPTPPLAVPTGFTIARVFVRNKDLGDRKVEIQCGSQGRTPTYALEISGGTGKLWLVVAGLTGQVFQVENDDKAREILSATGEGLHAD